MPLVGMAAVLAELAAGGGKKGLKKMEKGAAAAGASAVSPPRGARYVDVC